MKNLYPIRWSICLFLLISLSHCKKNADSNNCADILKVKITGAKASYYTGDTISLGTSLTPLALYIWSQTNAPNAISSSDHVLIYSASKNDEGWYYLSVSYPDCASHSDSVHITVTNKPVTAPCTPTNNSVTFSAIPSVTFGSVTYGTDPSTGLRRITGNPGAGYPDLEIYFNPFWNGKEPEDGAYSLSNEITFPDYNPYAVFISSSYSGIYFEADPGTVYISHTGGKLAATFCTLGFTGEFGGKAYKTSASGKLTAP
ncbi:MAG TPA: hypothetical protein VK563_00150 [Puia sp.]|nr:hypothetical protein [Puia sp.]